MSKPFISPTSVYHGAFKVASPSARASEAQFNFISSLLAQKDVQGELRLIIEEALDIRDIDKKAASALIDSLKECPYPEREVKAQSAPQEPTQEIPAGRYALKTEDEVKFYKLNYGKKGGRWEGFTFLSVQAGPDEYPIRNRETKAEILAEIAKDPLAAMVLYGHELGRCGKCGSPLTDATSRAAGIGPVCAKAF